MKLEDAPYFMNVRGPTSYWHALDSESLQNYQVPPALIGISADPTKDQLQALKARIFQGAKHVELGFFGKEKGSLRQGATTPEMFGKEERDAMRQMAKINDVTVSTHSAVNVIGHAGLGSEGKFDESQRQKALFEAQRSIEFAADVAEGGPVVVHTGEFPRPIYGVEKEKPDMFTGFPEEKKKRVHYLVDEKDGRVIKGVREDVENFGVRYKRDSKTGDYEYREDMFGHKIKVPEIDEEGKVITEKKEWDWYIKEAERLNKKKSETEKLTPAQLYYEDSIQAKIDQARGQADEYELHYNKYKEMADKYREALNFWKDLEPRVPDDKKRWIMMREHIDANLPAEEKNPVEYLKKRLWETEKAMSYGQEIASSARTQMAEAEDAQKRAVPIEEFAIKKSADSYAQLGVFAMREQEHKHLKKPLFVSPENLFNEQYGSHPQELKNIIVKSRERMVDLLTKSKIDGENNPNYRADISSSEAKKRASEHIKATFDIGHANTWRKYFTGKPEEFKKWMLGQVADLQKEGVLGHVHITDNFGYYDEHVTPGQGNIPLKEFVEELRKGGFKQQMIVEPGHQDWQMMTGTWRALNSPIYKIDGAWQTWTDVEHGYFGETRSPRYMFGEMAPDPKMWTLWSEIPLE